MENTMDTLIINIQSSTDSATKSIGKLISSLKKLQSELDTTINTSKGLSSLKDIKVGTTATSKLNTSVGNTKQQSVKTMDVDSKLMDWGVDLADSQWQATSVMKNLNTETTKYKNTLGQVVTVTRKTKNGIDNYNISLKSTLNNQKNFNDTIKILGTTMNKVSAKFAGMLTSVILFGHKAIGFIENAASEAEALNLFIVSLGKNAQKGQKWIKEFSEALYLDPVQVMQYMGSFNSLIEGLGVGSDNAYKMSKNLTQLVYDLSSFKNITIQSAYEKLMSGISGELEPLRNVGVAMSEATLQTLAYELGIEKLVRNMTEAEKAQLRYIQIMRSSKEWQTDMGRTLIQPANALRVMRQQFTLLGRAIGKVFIPLLMEAMPYVIAFTQIVTALAERIAKLFGYEIGDMFNYEDLGDISASIEDIGNSAESAADKLNTMLAPFDDLNVVQKESKSNGSGLGGIGGDLGVDLPEYDALAKLNEEFAKAAEKAKEKLEDFIPVLTTIGAIMLGWKIAEDVVEFFNFWKSVGLSATKVIGLTLGIAGISMVLQGTAKLQNEDTFWEGLGLKLGGTLAIAGGTYMFTKNIGVTLYVTGISMVLQGVKDTSNDTTMWLGIGESLGGAISLGVGTFLLTKNIAVALAVTSLSIFLTTAASVTDLIDLQPTWDEFVRGINELPWAVVISDYILTPLFVDLPKGVGKAFSIVKEEMSKWWKESWEELGKEFELQKESWSENWSDFTSLMSGMWSIMVDDLTTRWNNFWGDVGKFFSDGKEQLSNDFTELKTNISTSWDETWTDVKTTVSTKWTEAKDWFTKNFGTKEDWKEKFKSLTDGASEKLNELKQKFENWTAKIKTPHFEWDSNGTQTKGLVKKALEALNLPTSLPKLKINWYEDGGYPTSGDLFFANENGIPEMVGRIGNQTAVANNDQITASLTNALLSALNQYDFGGGNSPTTIYIGNRKVYEGYGDYVADENDRYGTNMIKI